MNAPTTPPSDDAGRAGDGETTSPGGTRRGAVRRGAARARPVADLELMLALRGAANARDLRNRVVRPGSAETRAVEHAGEPAAAAGTVAEDDDAPGGHVHPN